MSRKKTFPTQSKYEGAFNAALRQMEGYGCYMYPDGSEYRGFFSNGLFEGYGTLKLAAPYKSTIKGNFEKGICKEMDEIIFSDGLKFKGTYEKKGAVNAERWKYCTHRDRRYVAELNYGIEPVGPNSYLTQQKPTRGIPENTFDTEEGVFQPLTGLVTITENIGQSGKSRFIGCPEEREWIVKSCRYAPISRGTRRDPIEPEGKVCRQIIKCNLDAVAELNEDPSTCLCKMEEERKYYFGNLSQMKSTPPASEKEIDQYSGLNLTPSSSTVESLSEIHIEPLEISESCPSEVC